LSPNSDEDGTLGAAHVPKNETAAGAAIFALSRAYREAEDDRLKLIVGNFLVPSLRVPPGG
jgi:hypothetical protein